MVSHFLDVAAFEYLLEGQAAISRNPGVCWGCRILNPLSNVTYTQDHAYRVFVWVNWSLVVGSKVMQVKWTMCIWALYFLSCRINWILFDRSPDATSVKRDYGFKSRIQLLRWPIFMITCSRIGRFIVIRDKNSSQSLNFCNITNTLLIPCIMQ